MHFTVTTVELIDIPTCGRLAPLNYRSSSPAYQYDSADDEADEYHQCHYYQSPYISRRGRTCFNDKKASRYVFIA